QAMLNLPYGQRPALTLQFRKAGGLLSPRQTCARPRDARQIFAGLAAWSPRHDGLGCVRLRLALRALRRDDHGLNVAMAPPCPLSRHASQRASSSRFWISVLRDRAFGAEGSKGRRGTMSRTPAALLAPR